MCVGAGGSTSIKQTENRFKKVQSLSKVMTLAVPQTWDSNLGLQVPILQPLPQSAGTCGCRVPLDCSPMLPSLP